MAPATVEAGLADFLMALDTVGATQFGGKNVSAAEWFSTNFLNSKEIVDTSGGHVANKDTAGKSGIAAESRPVWRLQKSSTTTLR